MSAPDEFLLTDAVVLTCDEADSILNDGAVLVSGKEIADLGPREELEAEYSDCPRVELDGKLLMPGLVNSHMHLRMSALRGLAEDLSLEEWLKKTYRFRKTYLDDTTQKLGVKLSLAESIKCGVTTVADMSFHQFLYYPIVRETQVRAVLYDTIMDVYMETERPDEILEFIDRDTPDRITTGAALHAPYSTTPELMEWFKREIVDATSVPYSIHLAEVEDENEECREEHGVSSTRWLADSGLLGSRLLAVHGVWLSEADIELLAENEVSLSHNPESNMKLGAGVAPVVKMLEGGLTLGLGTDGAASNNDLDLFAEADTAGKLQKVHHKDPEILNANQLIDMLTINSARALGLGDRIGSVEVGKQADLITVDLNQLHLRPLYNLHSQLAYSVTGQDVRDVWIGGREVMRERELKTIDEAQLLEEINQANHRINRQRKREKEAILEEE